MEQSYFVKWLQKWFPGIVLTVVNTLNDTKTQPGYLHRAMLRKQFSVTGKWESVNVANTRIMADVVAMDSPLPLKKRDALAKKDGDIPKMGMELKLNEKQLTELDLLVAQGGNDAQIISAIFADTPRCVTGIFERNEAMFLEGLSTGVTLVEDAENVGTGIRLDYGYNSANKFGVSVLWSNAATAKPFDDIQRVLDKASLDGNTITKIMLDRTAFNNLAKATQTKELFAFYAGFVGATIPVPSLTQINGFVQERYNFTFQIVDRSVRYEKNGSQVAYKPWADGAVVFLISEQVGALVYARLAEQNHPVAGVTYETADDFILVSKFRTNRPSLAEFTTSQARVVPVISNVDSIYLMDSKTVQA